MNHYDAHMKLTQYCQLHFNLKKKEPQGNHCVMTLLMTIPNYQRYTVFKTFYLSNKVLNTHLKYSTQKD